MRQFGLCSADVAYPIMRWFCLRFFCKELELLRTVFEEADVDGDLATIFSRADIPVIPVMIFEAKEAEEVEPWTSESSAKFAIQSV